MHDVSSLQPVTGWQTQCAFAGAVSVADNNGTLSPWRIPFAEKAFFPFLSEGDSPVAAKPSGVRLTFATDAGRIGLVLERVIPGLMLDVCVDGSFQETLVLTGGQAVTGIMPLSEPQAAAFSLPSAGIHQIEIWLDPRHECHISQVLVTPGNRIWTVNDRRRRWIHYGSSISHAQAAATPSMIWPGIAARYFDFHLTNLGYSGQCVLEPMIGRMIRDLPADLVTMKLGINTHGGRLSARTFGPCAIGLIKLIREKHPVIPLVVISPIYSPPRETVRMTELGMTLQEMRTTLADIVQTCRGHGDRHISYIDGLSLFGPEELPWLPDELHPNADGQAVMAEHFIRELRQIIG